jgi:energy-coupling factor transporter ATP-binding protein EcfA2
VKVTELEVENFKRISSVVVKLKPHITEISGPNGSGKSSWIDAMWTLIKGKKVAPTEPIRKGAERARIRGRIGEYLVTRTFKRTKGGDFTMDLRIERGDEAVPPTEQFMRQLIGEHMLDPGDFIKLDSDGKFDVFRSFVPQVDFKKIAAQNLADYQRRTDVNRMAKEALAAAHMIVVPEGTPEGQIDRSALVAELEGAGKTNTDIERRRGNRDKVLTEIARLCEIKDSVEKRILDVAVDRERGYESRLSEIDAQIKALQEQREAFQRAYHRDIDREFAGMRDEAAQALKQATELQAKLDAAGELPKPIDTAVLAEKIRDADKVNENIVKRQTREKHLKTAQQYETESEQLTDSMNARERAKQEAIAAAKIPIPGITFGDGEVFLDGVPFEQASTAQKFRVGVAIAVAKNPTLRLVWVRDASLLDDHSYELIGKLAAEFDCQILLETVRAIGKDAIVLEDGHVKEMADEAVPA